MARKNAGIRRDKLAGENFGRRHQQHHDRNDPPNCGATRHRMVIYYDGIDAGWRLRLAPWQPLNRYRHEADWIVLRWPVRREPSEGRYADASI